MLKNLWVLGIALTVALAGCGTIGPPIPPEEVGLAAKIIEQKEKERKAKGKEAKPEEEDEVVLPPVRPIGTSAGSQAVESTIEAK